MNTNENVDVQDERPDIESMTKASLKQLLQQKLGWLGEQNKAHEDGLLTPDEIEHLKDEAGFIEAIKARIDAFPQIDDLGERYDSLKSWARKPSGGPPAVGRPAPGAGGDGSATPDPRRRGGGSPQSRHDSALKSIQSSLKSLGQMVVEELERDEAAGGGWQAGKQQSWGRELKHLDRLYALGLDNDADPDFVKSLLTSTTSELTSQEHAPGIVMVPTQRLTVADLLGQGTTTRSEILYTREISFTNAADMRAEGIAKPEAEGDLEELVARVRKVAVFRKITDEMLADHAQLRSYIDGRLRFMVLQREEEQLLRGNGTAPNLEGILEVDGVQEYTKGDDDSDENDADAVHRAITLIQSVGFDEPTGIVVHPSDWQNLKLHKDANEQYLGGGPFWTPYAGSGAHQTIRTLWGYPAVVTTAMTAGTALVGNFRTGAALWRRSGVTVQMTNTDQDDFIKNLVTIRAESRLALTVYQPLSFCVVDGLGAGGGGGV